MEQCWKEKRAASKKIEANGAEAPLPKICESPPMDKVRYAEAMKNAGVDAVVIPEHEGGLVVARQLQEFLPLEKKFHLNIETEKRIV